MSKINYLSTAVLALVILCCSSYLSVSGATTVTGESKTSEPQTHHRLVIQANKADTDEQDHILSNIVNLQKFYGMDNIEIEVVAYGPGIWLVTDKSKFVSRVQSLMLQNVAFTACGNTLDTIEASTGTRPTLLDDVETTPAGIARIIERQEQGWSYLSP
ncbi:DsrE family protein [Candidatus Thiothrix sp. Deng01]|uniref:DsrE family protein n=1 Tax=Candidatus Thiothrix phosphatis TaxID=3112415 RepID=A0ABU6CTG3_9GAMM|nr:DsrE family protein [Candidatus Thiothrix sp. Deng01]MEB4589817.1 DsrE family protein [Candidatus Thiothrix sp. Deng01]